MAGRSFDSLSLAQDDMLNLMILDTRSAPTVMDVVQAFKSQSTVEYIRLVNRGQAIPFDKHVWQRSFYDHVIRNDRDYAEIWRYIDENPLKWKLDRFYIPE